MKLLLITERLDQKSGLYGFFHGWVEEFAKQCEEVTVITLSVGTYTLPKNVRVISMGKKIKHSRLVDRIGYMIKFYRNIISMRKNYSHAFVHMNSIYIFLGYPIWKFLSKPIYFWYAHGAVSVRLYLAEKLVTGVFTSTTNGFRIKSPKRHIVGQGVDTKLFSPHTYPPSSEPLKIITVSRLSKSKHIDQVIKIYEHLQQDIRAKLCIVGEPATQSDEQYLQDTKNYILDKNITGVTFAGSIANNRLTDELQKNHIFISCSTTNSLDKTLLEAMACGLLVFSPNYSFKEIMPQEHLADTFCFDNTDSSKKISQQISSAISEREMTDSHRTALRATVVNDHSLSHLIKKILSVMSKA